MKKLLQGSFGRALADGSARIWNGFLSFAILPIYLSFVGAESIGVVSAFASIQAVVALFDFGLAPSLTRAVARAKGSGENWQEVRVLARTMELIYWALAVVAGIVFFILVPYVASSWLNPEKLSIKEIELALYIAGLSLVIQWPSTLYTGGLVGLEKQRVLSLISIVGATLRAALTVFFLWYVSASLYTLFTVSLVITAILTMIMRSLFWGNMPKTETNPHFDWASIKNVWKFAIGISVTTISSVLLLQTDKIALSKLLPLDDFGYYTLSAALANGLFIFTGAIFSVSYPRLSALAASNNKVELVRFFHLACQGVVAVVLPISAVIAFYSYEILLLWTKNETLAHNGQWVLTVFIIGNVLNCLLSVPYTVQLAYGVTRVAMLTNIVSLIIAIPLIITLFQWVGALSGPITWAMISFFVMIIHVTVVYIKFLPGEANKWWLRDAALPVLMSFGLVGLTHTIFPSSDKKIVMLLVLFFAWALSMAGTFIVLPDFSLKILSRKNSN